MMNLFRRKREKDVLDLTERLRKREEQISQVRREQSPGDLGFLGSLASSVRESENSDSGEYLDISGADEKRKKLAKRLMDMTEKMEDLSNQIYHLQQRIEVLEQKMRVGRFE
jgi:chromosome segregation ATPase